MNCAVHPETPAVAYCRTCGKALCENCKRDVMGAIYCEPCIAARLHPGQAPPAAVAPAPLPPGIPNPGIAAFLGFIPGVGAMYNGQFLKGFIHVMIFVLLILGADHFWVFGLMIPFFVFYMVFEAYKTAQARQLGVPAPDPLGIERLFGFQETHSPPPSPPASSVEPGLLPPLPPPRATHSGQPIGAIVLIVLGVLFLLARVIHLSADQLWPVSLIAVGIWIAYKRLVVRT